MIFKSFIIAALLTSLVAASGCSAVESTGEAVEGVGEGTGHAIAATGRAVEHGAERTRRDM